MLTGLDVLGIPVVSDPRAGDEVGLNKSERAGADRLGNRFERIRDGDVFGHDERHRCAAFADEFHEDRQRLLQCNADRAVIPRTPFVNELADRLTDHIARRPPTQAGDAILGADWLAIVEFQPVSKPNYVGSPIVRG